MMPPNDTFAYGKMLKVEISKKTILSVYSNS